MSGKQPTREKVIMWGLESRLLSNYDLHTDFIRVPLDELTDFAERVYAAGFEAGKKKSCADLAKSLVDGICDSEKGSTK